MTKEEIIEVVNIALTQHEERQKAKARARHDKRLHNTKLLLENYNLLKIHCSNSVDNLKDIDPGKAENAIDILDSLEDCTSDIYIESIKRSVTRTIIIINHIDTMIELYEIYCQRSKKPEDLRMYRTIYDCYISEAGMEIEDIAIREGVVTRTSYRDINSACEKLSALIFGIDGLSKMSQTCQ